MQNKKRIAIIGSGISGLSSAYFLKNDHEVTLYEKSDRIGGHSRTIDINGLKVDTGFIVLNDATYPNLNKLFTELKIDIVKTEMSFAISANDGALEWSGTSINSLFVQRKNIFNIPMLKGIFDILKFNKSAMNFVAKAPDLTLGELIDQMKLGSWFREYYILPMGGAIWSCPYEAMMEFPASTFVNFFENHGLLSISNRPQWYTLKNRSISYVRALEDLIEKSGRIIKNASIDYIKRTQSGIELKESGQEFCNYDEVIFACHPKEVLAMLKDPSSQEQIALEKFSRQKNIVYTHSDSSQMPKLKGCWSSWNYLYNKEENSKVSVTYWMNKLQHIDESFPLFVTLNPTRPIAQDKIYDTCDFYHPVFDQKSIEGQKAIDKLQGVDKIWFCGAYLRYGFHEDGIWSATNIVNKINQKF